MFTGLIEKKGLLEKIERIRGGTTITVSHASWKMPLEKGESMAVNGICFTVTSASPGSFTCDVLDETADRTNIGTRMPGAPLNLERALKAGDAVGGHFVSGHIDGVARLVSMRDAGRDKILRFECDAELLEGMVAKGSVACDGVSLTISALAESFFEVNVIPFTWSNTSLSSLTDGDRVNIETDMLGKYVRRYITGGKAPPALDFDILRNAGFIE